MVVETGTSANELLEGSELSDTLDGTGGNDTINGLGGADSLVGGFGADSIDGGAGNDTIIGTTGLSTDEESSPIGADTLIGGAGDDSINGYGNNTYAEGGTGNDSLYGGPGSSDDTLDGGTGADLLWGQGGADVYYVDNFGDDVQEFTYDTMGLGNTATGDVDEIRASISWVLRDWNDDGFNIENLTLLGSASINATANEVGNVLIGNSGSNLLRGLAGDDTIDGGSGNDTIDGGTGDDLMTGGTGADTFVFDTLSGDDTITDFEEGTDALDLSAFSQSQIDAQIVSEDIDGNRIATIGNSSVTFLGLSNVPDDDFLPGATAGLGSVSIGGRTTGEIETSGDIDGFRVTLDNDTTYRVDILGSGSNNGTLIDPDLLGIFSNSNFVGTPVGSVQTLNPFFIGDDSTSYFTPDSAGDYFIGVQDEYDGLGSYTVAVTDIGVRDDFAADISTSGSIAPDGSALGSIDFAQDEDWFQASLSANRLYQIELAPTAGGSALSDPFFRGVYDSDGILVQNTENDDGGTGTNSKLQFVTDETGIFYLSAGGFVDITGDYQLQLNDLGPLDDNSFDITVEYTSDDVPNVYIDAFEDAVERWEEIITGDLDYGFVEGYGFVDDILIEVAVADFELTFEGVEQTILAISTVLDQRDDAAAGAGALPTYSRIVLNSEEIGELLNPDELAQNTIGRSLGFGALWEEFGLVRDIDGVPTYTGSNALREIADLSDDLNGQNVLEGDDDGALAADYWSEANLDAELMTPRVELRRPENGPAPFGLSDNPISELTIAAMQDLGYEVNYGAADPYSLPRGALSRIDITVQASEVTDQSTIARRTVADLPDSDDIPGGVTTIYNRPNSLTEATINTALSAANTILISASSGSVVFFEQVTGNNYLIEVSGAFDKDNLASVGDLSGAITGMEVFSTTGTLLLSVDYSRRPIEVSDVLANWPSLSEGDDDIIVVDALPGTVVRINPDGGTENDSRIFTGEGDDYVRGGDGAELINGGAQDDTLLGQDGDDILIGESGDDEIKGGSGTDTAVYSGDQARYTLTLSPTGTTITDRSTTGNGTDQLSDIEILEFDTDIFDGGFNLGIFGGPTSLSESQFESFIELYIAYFNRAPDAIGLNFWGTAFANGTSLEETASLFIDQDETRTTYPSSLSNADFATAVYANVLGRVADQVGYNFWVGVLDDGSVGRDQFILAILGGAKAAPPDGATAEFITQQLADQAYLSNKTDLGAYYAVHKGMSDVGNASAAMALFDGSQQSLESAVAAIAGYHQAALSSTTGEFLMPLVGVLDDPFV